MSEVRIVKGILTVERLCGVVVIVTVESACEGVSHSCERTFLYVEEFHVEEFYEWK